MDRREFMELSTRALALASASAWSGKMLRDMIVDGPPARIDAAAFNAMRRFATTSFGKIAYVERGRGKVALFLHGYPLNGFQWRGAIERLSGHRLCIAPDYMGLGYSEVAAEQSLAPEAQMEMIHALLETLSVSTVDIIANDSGGAIAQLFVAKYPERVRSLLLTNCDTAIDSPPPSFMPIIALAKAGQFADKSLVPQLANKELARSAKGIGGLAYSNPLDPSDEVLEMYFRPLVSSELRKRQVEGYAIALEQNALEGIEPALRKCKVPTRILWGMADRIFSSASPAWLDQAFGNSKGVRAVEGAKLFFPEEMPDLIAEEARRLWGVA
ncbi:MAG TPA: alpha/beta hydrolase [Gemmatimonadaceae bacterium]|nr:alpha/beta hydrolase [Gemmatimonadaceae bacterium]